MFVFSYAPPQQVELHLEAAALLKEGELAKMVAQQACAAYPNDVTIHKAALRLLAAAAQEEPMFTLYKQMEKKWPERVLDRDLLEPMAWAIVEKGAQAPTLKTRAMALVAAASAGQARGVALLTQFLSHEEGLLKLLAIELASGCRDAPLQEQILALLAKEKEGRAIPLLLRAAGTMQIKEAKPLLLARVTDTSLSGETRRAAVEALAALTEPLTEKEHGALIQSPQAGLRLLAVAWAAAEGDTEDVERLFPLLEDINNQVRSAALVTMVRGGVQIKRALLEQMAKDLDPEVAISAAWALTLQAPDLVKPYFAYWFAHPNQEMRCWAASALAATGRKGVAVASQFLSEQSDPFIQVNLARLLMHQQVDRAWAQQVVYQFLEREDERIACVEIGAFQGVVPARLARLLTSVEEPETVDQLGRLELLGELVATGASHALEAVAAFLHQRPWGVSGAATALLLMEGHPTVMEAIRPLLNHAHPAIALQAALVVGMWGADEEALLLLESHYFSQPQPRKEQILEALGRIGHNRSLPFLVARLYEPSASLRMAAAAAILRTLYH